MVSKRDLGVGYLVGLGLGLLCVMVGQLVFFTPTRFAALGVLVVGVVLGGSFIYVGVQLFQSSLLDENVWRVAQWGAVGLLLPVLLYGLFFALLAEAAMTRPQLFLYNIATGGIAGVLFGSVLELRRQNSIANRQNQRNAVLYRVLRHNLRTAMNVVGGHADRLERTADASVQPHTAVIRDQADEMVALSTTARQGDRRLENASPVPTDVTTSVDDARTTDDQAASAPPVETTVPERAVAYADANLDYVLAVLLRHARATAPDGAAPITLRVSTARWAVLLVVEVPDDGALHDRLAILTRDTETPLQHLDGVDLWVAKWLVDAYHGTLTTAARADATVVTVRLRRADSLFARLRYAVATGPV